MTVDERFNAISDLKRHAVHAVCYVAFRIGLRCASKIRNTRRTFPKNSVLISGCRRMMWIKRIEVNEHEGHLCR